MIALSPPKIPRDLPKARRYPFDVPGTANISYGHKLAERRHVAKYHANSGKSIFERAEDFPEDKREREQLLKVYEFEKETDRKIKNKNLRRRVEQGVSAYEESLRARREKLCGLVQYEDSSETLELAAEARRSEDSRIEKMLLITKEMREQQEREREALVAAKRAQRYFTACPTAREAYSKGCTLNAKRSNVAQIADNEARRSSEKDLEEAWHRAWQRRLETERLKETQELAKRASARRELATALARQVAEKLVLEVEERKRARRSELEELERLQEESRVEESRELELRQEQREKLKREMEEKVLEARRKRREELAREKVALDVVEGELIKERPTKDPDTFRIESLAYAGYLEDLRREEVEREREVEAAAERWHEDEEARRELERRKVKEARERDLREVLRAWEEQVRARRDAEEAGLRARTEEREVLERQIESDANSTAMQRLASRQKAYRYGLELKEQQRQRLAEEEKRRESEEAESRADEEDRMPLARETRGGASGKITRHPLRATTSSRRSSEECRAARYAPPRKGNCCCPPVLISV